jgi:hypothetical protein
MSHLHFASKLEHRLLATPGLYFCRRIPMSLYPSPRFPASAARYSPSAARYLPSVARYSTSTARYSPSYSSSAARHLPSSTRYSPSAACFRPLAIHFCPLIHDFFCSPFTLCCSLSGLFYSPFAYRLSHTSTLYCHHLLYFTICSNSKIDPLSIFFFTRFFDDTFRFIYHTIFFHFIYSSSNSSHISIDSQVRSSIKNVEESRWVIMKVLQNDDLSREIMSYL